MKKSKFTVSQMFSNHMVLQRDKRIKIWGSGTDGDGVCITIAGETTQTEIQDGVWMAELPPLSAGGPYEMELISGDDRISFEDILIGEVWFAGGQSNMELELLNSDDGENQVKAADYEQLRFYNVVKSGVMSEEVLEQQGRQQWKVCKPDTAADVSAVAYFCARKLNQKLQVPIGVIDCYIGGTSVTCWMDEETLQQTQEGRGYIERYAEKIGDKTEADYQAEMAEYNRLWKAWDDGVQAERQKNPDVTWEYLNEHVGMCPWPEPAGLTSRYRPTNPYQAMVTRIFPYTLRGFWYYQGEEDSYLPEAYGVLMQSLIQCWRSKWEEPEAPFILTQLPMYIAKHEPDDKCWAKIREQQALTAEQVPNTYMNVLIDCGEFDNIHPTDKLTVGNRMADICLEHVYDMPCHADAPKCQTLEIRGSQVCITFDGEALKVNGERIALFELAGADECFHPAQAELIGEHEVLIGSENVAEPFYARYAWTNYGKVTLFDVHHLPAAPFNRKL